MRIVPTVMVILFFVSFLLACTPVHAAVIYGGKLFHSQNFTTVVGGNFKIYGIDPIQMRNNVTGIMETHYKKAKIISDIDDDIELKNGTCDYTMLYKYCFKNSLVDLTNPKTFETTDIKSAMSITIESLPPSMTSLTVKRNMKVSAFCGEWIPMEINLTNGGTMLTNITYSETLPENTMILSTSYGDVDINLLTINDHLLPNTTKTYKYTMVNFDCQSKNWSGRYSFTAVNGSIISKNLTNIMLLMNNSFRINDSLTPNKTNGIRDEVNYTFWINNTHKSADIILDINFIAPGLIVTSSAIVSNTTTGFKYSGPLSVGSDLTLKLKYKAPDYGNYTVSAIGTIMIGDYKMRYNSTRDLIVVPANVTAYLDVNNYTMNNSLTVNVWAQNDDIKEKYYYIYGVLRGIGDEEPVYVNGVEPNSKVLVAKKVYNITGLGEKELQMEFDGVYRDKNGVEYPLSDVKAVYINGTNYTVKTTVSKTTKATTPKTTKVTNTTKSTVKNTTKTSANTTGSDGAAVEKKDFLTRIIEGLNNFFSSIFGK